MEVILDVHGDSKYSFGVFYCNTPEGYLSVRDSYLFDKYTIVGKDSWEAYEDCLIFLEFMGWSIQDYFAHTSYYDYMEEIAREAAREELYDMWMQEELNWYNWARQNGYE